VSGFVGLANAGGAPVDRRLLEHLTDAMAYCGPDGRDTWAGESAGLGHALLSPTSELGRRDAERQPSTLDGKTWIAADARIDARPELARDLRAAGREVAADAPDWQLVLHAHAVWGVRCPEHLLGDFAFAIWDSERRELLCARDHFGVIPFFYADAGHGLAFGNVLRALLSHPDVSDALNDQAIGHFLALDCNDDLTTTTFADVRSLPPAHTLAWRDGDVRIRRYWELDPAPPELRLKRGQEYVERFAAVLDRAVDDRLRANRVGAHLSGGMDSSSLVATAGAVLSRRDDRCELRAYTIVYGDLMPEDEEGRYAAQIATRLNLPLEMIVADDYAGRPPDGDVRWAFPEPFRIPNQLPDYELAARAARFSRILLSGLGGDPLFAARPSASQSLRAGRRPPLGIRTALRRRRRLNRPEPPDWIDGQLVTKLGLAQRVREIDAEARHQVGVSQMTSPLWPTIFARAHPGSFGLPIRFLFPFFDLRVVRCVAETPVLPWHPGKHLLREAMREHLPPAVLERPKTPLYVSTARGPEPWLRLALRTDVRRQRERLLEVPELRRYVDVARARQRVEVPSSPGMFSFERCLALAHWLRTQGEGNVGPSD
jgi:asparagine synthase (glutamine-hydrolysing)